MDSSAKGSKVVAAAGGGGRMAGKQMEQVEQVEQGVVVGLEK